MNSGGAADAARPCLDAELPGEDSNLGLVDQNHLSFQLDDPGMFGS
jgi:hypothetical protein